MPITTCPRCGQPLPEGTYLEEMKSAEGRQPAFRLRHPKGDGERRRWCVAYVGPEAETQESGGEMVPTAAISVAQ